MGYKYNPDPKWRISFFNTKTDKLEIKEVRSYTEISNDEDWSKIVRNKDHFHNVYKRNSNKFKNKNLSIVKLR